MTPAAIVGLLIDAALGGLAVADAFQEFKKARDPNETPEQAAAAFVEEMLANVKDEQAADDALAKWRAKHGSN